jgi:hypothetical protein
MPATHRLTLLCEGDTDAHFLYHFLRARQLGVVERDEPAGRDQVLIRHCGSVRTAGSVLHGLLGDASIDALGVVLDWDDPDHIASQDSRWEQVRGTLDTQGYSPPQQLPGAGLVLDHPSDEWRPRVGVWIMPNNEEPGMVEDFAARLIRDEDVLWPYAETTVAGLPERRFSAAHTAKARIHTWLAWQKTPGQPMGQALKQCYLDPTTPAGQCFHDWLARLFWPDAVAVSA